jgi:hypothetical protein
VNDSSPQPWAPCCLLVHPRFITLIPRTPSAPAGAPGPSR